MSCIKVTTIKSFTDRLPAEICDLMELAQGGLFKLQKYSTDSWCSKIKAIRIYPGYDPECVVLDNNYWAILLGTSNWIKIIKSLDGNYFITSSDSRITFTLKALLPPETLLLSDN